MVGKIQLLFTLVFVGMYGSFIAPAYGESATDILERANVTGGLLVVLGCDSPQLLMELRPNERFVVQGLDTDAAKVAAARQAIQKRGGYGPVSVNLLETGNLPYVDNLVNLLVVSRDCGVSKAEMERVLAPERAIQRIGERPWIKPRPEAIDDWTHYLHGPDNNMLSQDTRVGSPRRLQWIDGPLWMRSHEYMSSFVNMVSAGGRVFYLMDEGMIGITDSPVPDRWALIARDAFNGLHLWKHPLPTWNTTAFGNRGLREVPYVTRNVLAVSDTHVFFTFELNGPVSVLDARDGKVLRTVEGSDGTVSIRLADDRLVLCGSSYDLKVYDAKSFKPMWELPGRFEHERIAVSGGRVFLVGEGVIKARDLASGKQLWQQEAGVEDAEIAPWLKSVRLVVPHRIFVQDDVLVHVANTGRNQYATIVRSAASGELRWRSEGQVDFLANDLLWRGTAGLDPATGEVKYDVPGANSVRSQGHHYRCYDSKATVRYLIDSFRGAEFISLTGGEHYQNDWTRGSCKFGVLPANGLLYVPPDPCACYPGIKILGLHAMAPDAFDADAAPAADAPSRLTKGPAYEAPIDPAEADAGADAWPTYRQNPARHGSTRAALASDFDVLWRRPLGGKGVQAVIANGRAFVVETATDTLHALSLADGKTQWSFTAGGRIDSPPTIADGRVLFGAADGWVYCLRASDGRLIWRFRAAPVDRRIVAFGRVESVWPVHGSVVLSNGRVYFAAGRASVLDGGLWLYGLDPETGKVLCHRRVDTWSRTREDAVNTPIIPAHSMDGTRNFILTAENDALYMGQMKFDLDLNRAPTPWALPSPEDPVERVDLTGKPYDPFYDKERFHEMFKPHRYYAERFGRVFLPRMKKPDGTPYEAYNFGDLRMGRHVIAQQGFLDDSYFNRNFWMYAETWPGFNIANRAAKTGQLLVVDAEKTYAVKAFTDRGANSPVYEPGHGYLLLADDNDTEPVIDDKDQPLVKGLGYTREKDPVWYRWIDIRVLAMLKSADKLFVLGVPDEFPPEDPMAAIEGRLGSRLLVLDADSGETVAESEFDFLPAFDGVSAVDGKLLVALKDGGIVCFAGKEE